jgi:hypothetical protein
MRDYLFEWDERTYEGEDVGFIVKQKKIIKTLSNSQFNEFCKEGFNNGKKINFKVTVLDMIEDDY